MKNRILTLMCVLTIGTSATSCKNNAKEVDATAAEPVAKSAMSSAKYNVDVSNSTIEWKGFKPTGTHNGTVNIESGVLTLEDNTLQSGTIIINMNSIVALDVEGDKRQNLEAHLKGTVEGKEGDFFNVNKYPSAGFEITGVTTDSAGKTILSGNLKLKDIQKNVSFPVTVSTSGNTLSIVSETFEIDRTVWGVNYGSKSVFDNLGDKFINDEIALTIKVNASKS
ncbi:YceI family protein [Formosa sp. PL04]|uniref:YceI family protein n=1 Tax=Formosa sp. PL04 TaxID=3081755 RepID=UPI002980E1F1|nr:YceI family protein [Formosa sp. PL04]MDW5290516.1 YceI family protein [Formosa sp. PL04]